MIAGAVWSVKVAPITRPAEVAVQIVGAAVVALTTPTAGVAPYALRKPRRSSRSR